MTAYPGIDDVMYPPFNGFPKECLAFLRALKKNNNRPWFLKRKEAYEEHVKFPMQCLIAALAVRMADEAPEIVFDPRRSVFRVYRDVRFSKNKAPYKTSIAASFEVKGKKGRADTPVLYVGVQPGEVFIGGGLYMPYGDQLKAIRRSIAERPEDYLSVVRSTKFKRRFGGVTGEKLSKAPFGYPKDHPMIEHLRYKQFFVGVELPDKASLSAGFARTVVSVFTDAMPLVRWLDRAMA